MYWIILTTINHTCLFRIDLNKDKDTKTYRDTVIKSKELQATVSKITQLVKNYNYKAFITY